MNCDNCQYIIPTSCVKYDGPSTINLGFSPGMTLNQILALIDAAIGIIPPAPEFGNSITTTILGNGSTITPYTVNVNVSPDVGNILTINPNGLYVPTPPIGVTTGSSTQSGTGVLLSFNIPHGLSSTPSYWIVEAASTDAQGITYTTSDATNITVNYNVAPPAGSNNLTFKWSAKI